MNSNKKPKLQNHIHFTSLAHSPLQLSESWEAPRLVVGAQQQPTSAQRWDNTADCRLGATMFSVEAPALAFFLGQLDEAEISQEKQTSSKFETIEFCCFICKYQSINIMWQASRYLLYIFYKCQVFRISFGKLFGLQGCRKQGELLVARPIFSPNS